MFLRRDLKNAGRAAVAVVVTEGTEAAEVRGIQTGNVAAVVLAVTTEEEAVTGEEAGSRT